MLGYKLNRLTGYFNCTETKKKYTGETDIHVVFVFAQVVPWIIGII